MVTSNLNLFSGWRHTKLKNANKVSIETCKEDNIMPMIQIRSSSIIGSVDLHGVPTVPTAPADIQDSQIASTQLVEQVISELVDSAPSILNTLAELAASMSNDDNQT